MPPITFQRTKVRYRMFPTPATTGVKVRTMGTNRAMTIVREPYWSKNSCARSTLACLKNRESGRWNRAGPTRWPIA